MCIAFVHHIGETLGSGNDKGSSTVDNSQNDEHLDLLVRINVHFKMLEMMLSELEYCSFCS